MSYDLILVDGYSVIYAWPELRARRRRRLASAREELIGILGRFADESGAGVAVVFDGRKSPPPEPIPPTARGLEVIFSKRGQTADEIIERCVAAAREPARLCVVTEDGAERRLCEGFGARVVGAEELWGMVGVARTEFEARLDEVRRRGAPSRKMKFRS